MPLSSSFTHTRLLTTARIKRQIKTLKAFYEKGSEKSDMDNEQRAETGVGQWTKKDNPIGSNCNPKELPS